MKKLILTILILLLASVGWAADATYQTKVYKDSGGDRQVVASGGEIMIEQDGILTGLTLKVASIVMTGVDYTLSTAEALCNILVVTGSPSGQSIIAPTLTTSGASLLYTVRNAGGDSAAVTLKASGETGVAIATGKTAAVYFLTDDYVRLTADATN
jgi:hypothetical protein